MKVQYFTADTIGAKSREMLRALRGISGKHPLKLTPRRSALLVLDMQRCFFEESSHAYIPSARAIVPGVARIAESFLRVGSPVVFTRHVNSDTDAGMMAMWWQDLISRDSRESEIIPEFVGSRPLLLIKNQYDAFYGTALDDILEKEGVRQVVICGVMTHLCCETTARSAFMRGFEVFFVVDGTATYNEEFHRAALLNLAHGFALPVLQEDVLSALGGGNED